MFFLDWKLIAVLILTIFSWEDLFDCFKTCFNGAVKQEFISLDVWVLSAIDNESWQLIACFFVCLNMSTTLYTVREYNFYYIEIVHSAAYIYTVWIEDKR